MPRTRVLIGTVVGLVVCAGAIVAAVDSGPDYDTAGYSPQSPRAVSGGVDAGKSNFDEFSTATGSGAIGGTPAAGGPVARTQAADGATTPAGGVTPASAAGAGAATARVVKTATLVVTVTDRAIDSTAGKVPGIASVAGGFVTSSQRSGTEDRATAQFTIRVPADRFDSTREALGKLGKVSDETLSGRDVSGVLVDYEARLRSMRAEEEAFRSILGKANTVGETLQVTQALAEVRGRIEQLDAQRAQLADSADLSTITVTIAGPAGVLTPSEPQPLLARSLERAFGAALGIIGGTIIVLGAAVPLGVIALAALLIARMVSRRRRQPAATVASSA